MEINYVSGAVASLWKSGISSVYLFHGEEDRLKTEALEALIEHLVEPGFEDFDLERLNANSIDALGILSAAGQMPFGSKKRVIVVRGMEQWREKNKSGEVEKLVEGLPALGENCSLLLYASAEEEEGRRKTAVTTKLDNAVKKLGCMVSCGALKGAALTNWIRARVRKEGIEIDSEASETLVDAVGSELLLLEQELLKLCSYSSERKLITVEDVHHVTASSPDDVIFTLVDSIVRRQTDRAMTLLLELNRYEPKPQAVAGRLLALLARQYRMLWQAKFLAEKHMNPREVRSLPEEISRELPGESNIAQMAFKAGELFTQSRSYRWSDLQRAMDTLLLCDLANKGGVQEETDRFGSDPVGNLQLLVLELTGTDRPSEWRA